jgi:AraC-like DNA-binding protein
MGLKSPSSSLLDSLKRLVERHLDSPALSAGFVCARSGWSRATVYRVFEAEGGLARYIRKRHLLGAFRELTSGQPPHLRIVDLALAHQFASEASFNRAFRRAFGIPPGKARHLATSSRGMEPDDGMLLRTGHGRLRAAAESGGASGSRSAP